MDRLDTIRIFVRVVESGSFSAVARELGIGQPTVSKQVAALEAHLGAQLLMRTSRKVALTEAGRDFFESASRLVSDLDAAESRIGRGLRSPSGLVRVSAAPSFGALYIVPRLPEFFRRYPDVSVEVHTSDRSANLVENGIDVAIRNGELAVSSLVARKLGASPIIVVASPAYLDAHGEPRRPTDLEQHRCIVFSSQTGARPWRFSAKSGHERHLPESAFRTNDGEQIRAAALAGIGLAQVPHWLCARELAAGTLRRVLRRYEPAPDPISAVRPANRRPATKLIVFIDFLAEALATIREAR
ncbi:MAG: LysR family transcriptional regulator [Labilithrix sp.]|nr:LysR family transcriptional regulator [Labilithrix sp.]MBX3216907.1 LysR family transcriptional regulator [Labilithrix sp.]